MKSEPVVMKGIQLENETFILDLALNVNITILTGKAGNGKSVIFHMIRDSMKTIDDVICLNYENYTQNILKIIQEESGKLFVIDNADILIDDETRKLISMDTFNQYILIGRNPKNLFTTKDNLYEIGIECIGNKTKFYIVPCFT